MKQAYVTLQIDTTKAQALDKMVLYAVVSSSFFFLLGKQSNSRAREAKNVWVMSGLHIAPEALTSFGLHFWLQIFLGVFFPFQNNAFNELIFSFSAEPGNVIYFGIHINQSCIQLIHNKSFIFKICVKERIQSTCIHVR